jgi:hypothetical protein
VTKPHLPQVSIIGFDLIIPGIFFLCRGGPCGRPGIVVAKLVLLLSSKLDHYKYKIIPT